MGTVLRKTIFLIVIFLITFCSPVCAGDEKNETIPDYSDTLVVYFSATGTTEKVAEMIAEIEDADIYEILAVEPYSDADLNYSASNSRATREQNDADVRPEIGSEDILLEGYTTVYLGYPIWWGQAPRIMSTFVEGHNFEGITVIPFCTSGSSGIGQSAETLADQAGMGKWLSGQRFSGSVTEEELQTWIDELAEEIGAGDLSLMVNGEILSVAWEDNESVKALQELVEEDPLSIQMSMYGGFEQVGSIGKDLPRNDVQTITEAGDIVLYSGDQIVVFYGSNSWAYTRLGKVMNKSDEEMAELLGNYDVTVTISVK